MAIQMPKVNELINPNPLDEAPDEGVESDPQPPPPRPTPVVKAAESKPADPPNLGSVLLTLPGLSKAYELQVIDERSDSLVTARPLADFKIGFRFRMEAPDLWVADPVILTDVQILPPRGGSQSLGLAIEIQTGTLVPGQEVKISYKGFVGTVRYEEALSDTVGLFSYALPLPLGSVVESGTGRRYLVPAAGVQLTMRETLPILSLTLGKVAPAPKTAAAPVIIARAPAVPKVVEPSLPPAPKPAPKLESPPAPPAEVSLVWYLLPAAEGERCLPFTLAEMRAKWSRNEVNKNTQVWRKGIEWVSIAEDPELARAISGAKAEEPSPAEPKSPPPLPAEVEDWYYAAGSDSRPISFKGIERAVRKNLLKLDSQVWHAEHASQWTAIEDVPQFKHLLPREPEAPPPPPPPAPRSTATDRPPTRFVPSAPARHNEQVFRPLGGGDQRSDHDRFRPPAERGQSHDDFRPRPAPANLCPNDRCRTPFKLGDRRCKNCNHRLT